MFLLGVGACVVWLRLALVEGIVVAILHSLSFAVWFAWRPISDIPISCDRRHTCEGIGPEPVLR